LDGDSGDPDEPLRLLPWSGPPPPRLSAGGLCDDSSSIEKCDNVSSASCQLPRSPCERQPDLPPPATESGCRSGQQLFSCRDRQQSGAVWPGCDHRRLAAGPAQRRHRWAAATPVPEDPVQDTVGVVVLDRLGHVASSVSSGGIGRRPPDMHTSI
jgi:hypothetical protein